MGAPKSLQMVTAAMTLKDACLLDSVGEGEGGVIWEPPKIKSTTVSASISHEAMGQDPMILVF